MSTKHYSSFWGRRGSTHPRTWIRALQKSLYVAALVACLLPQTLLAAITSNVAGGKLTVTSDAGDAITIICDGGAVKINGADPGSGAANCVDITELEVTGGPDANVINLAGVDTADYTALITSTVSGDAGEDVITGTFASDLIVGDTGNDTMIGGAGDDTMVWNPGDGSDVADGGSGSDTMVVNGGGVSETFTISGTVFGARFDRVTPGPFFVDILTTTEFLVLNANGGGDIVTGTVGLAGILTTTVNGGAGDDHMKGTDGPDTLNGDEGDDLIVGFRGEDVMSGGDDDDTMVWNPGDGSDVADGGSGDDTMIVNGGGVSETFTISGTETGAFFQRVTPGPFSVDILDTTENLILNGNGGGDIVTGTVDLNGVLTTTVNGGDGDDFITGTDGPDTLNGDAGDDLIVGFRGADAMNGGDDDDTMVWNPGDGSDVADGGSGSDTMVVNGGGVSETFTISGTETGAFFQRVTPGPFSVDILDTTEFLILNGNGGGDIVTGTVELNGILTTTVNGGDGDDFITGTDGPDTLNGDAGDDLIVGFRGADVMSGGDDDDTMVWNPGDGSDVADGGSGDDTMIVNGGGVSETFTISGTETGAFFQRVTPGPFSVDILDTTENLLLNANGGGDIVTGTVGLNGILTTTVNGGDGDDLIKGTDGPDTLNGDAGDDTLIGFRGPDVMNGGDDNDTLVWNNGDGSDIMDGGAGDDVVVVNGSGVSETFAITPTTLVAATSVDAALVGSTFFQRVTPGPFSLDIEAESVEVNGNDGDDTFDVTPLENTGVSFDGGTSSIADVLRINAQGAAVEFSPSQVLIEGKQPVNHTNVETVEVLDEAFPEKIHMPLIREWEEPTFAQ